TGATLPPEQLADLLTKVGLNVEEVTRVGGGDYSLNADITTNRPDWLCHQGVAHEIAAIERRVIHFPDVVLNETGPDVKSLTSVTQEPDSREACPRYTVRVIRNVRVGPSPEWLRQRLEAIGQRSINNVVDITNLVCFEMNQPLHAFDMDKLAEKRIVLRLAHEGEQFKAITGESARLEPDMLVIADAEKAVALAGVKGGENTEVGDTTTNVLLESAWFQPRSTRRTARRAKMASESSYRYERGIDPGMTARASARAVELILQLAGGELATGVIDTNPDFGQPWEVAMRFARCDKVLGIAIPVEEVLDILKGLGLGIVEVDASRVLVKVPTFRQDLKREIDLIEEVIRLAGYDRVPEKITMPLALAHERPETMVARTVRRVLAGLGYHECITDSFVPEEWGPNFAPGAVAFVIQNPINMERPVLRTALTPSLLEVRRTNRLSHNVQLFEIGRIYKKTPNGPEEGNRLAILDDRGSQYVRGALEAVHAALSLAGTTSVQPVDELAGLQPGGGARMLSDRMVFAWLGQVSDAEAKRFDFDAVPAVAEADLDLLADAPKKAMTYTPLPRFPGVRRDISLAVEEKVLWGEVEEVARRNADMLADLSFVSLYRGKGVKPGFKALAFSMLLRAPDRSLTDADANAVRDKVAAALLAAFSGSELR
ncbi:MAG: phenylalanine--tRNA ligase subunit beta, partial [Planctomycetes bacterium]|nr:phenylalanine--tRNA ligase subunit beta [Planctomycetota bacterium]